MDTNTKENKITLKDIIRNEPRVIEVPGYGTITIKDPTVKDRIDAEVEASKHPMWKEWNASEKATETQKRLARRMLVDPSISEEEYMNSNDTVILNILDTVAMSYGLKLKELADKRKALIQHFLEQMREGNPPSTFIS